MRYIIGKQGKISTMLIAIIFVSVTFILFYQIFNTMTSMYDVTPSFDNSSFEDVTEAVNSMNESTRGMREMMTNEDIEITDMGLLFEGGKSAILTVFDSFILLFAMLKNIMFATGLMGIVPYVITGIIAMLIIYIVFQIISKFMARSDV